MLLPGLDRQEFSRGKEGGYLRSSEWRVRGDCLMSQLRLPLGAAAAVRSREHAIDVTTVFFCGDDQWPVIVNCYAEQFQLRFWMKYIWLRYQENADSTVDFSISFRLSSPLS